MDAAAVSIITSESIVVKVTVKFWFLSKASSSSIVMFTHLLSPLIDPDVKVSLEETLV